MANDKNSSILKEALTDYNSIREAADANAKKKLAEEFPEKFNNLLKEELQNKNKTKKESYKKLDEGKESESSDNIEPNKESVMKNEIKETKKVEETAGKDGVFTVPAKKVAKVEEDVKITDTVGKPDPFTEKAKKAQKVEENAGKDGVFTESPKKPLQTEEFNITELDVSGVGSALESADNQDEVITMDEIEKEIGTMNDLGEELKGINPASPSYMEKGNKGIAFDQLVSMRNQIDEMIKGMGQEPVAEMHQGNFPIDKMHAGEYDSKLIDEKGMEEMHAAGGEERFGSHNQVAQLHQGNPLIDEIGGPITDKDVESVLGGGVSEGEVDESHGVTYAQRRNNTGRHTPSFENLSSTEQDQSPEYVKESKKKIGGLIEENKKLQKTLNETKKYKQSVTTLVEQYKSALDKYRNQLKEMATFNTNLAHVNNLLVNESLALTQEDKIKIINEFKKVDTIAESQKKYKSFLTEMKGSKKTLTESIETKVSASIQPSSKQKLDEVSEKTAYQNDAHINKMKRIIETIEKSRSKKIIS